MAETYAKNVLGEKNVESVLLRLDRLSFDESRVTFAQTLDIVYGLVNNLRVVMKGTHKFICVCAGRDPNLVGGKASTGDIQQALGVSD